jgi:hypothetical protein
VVISGGRPLKTVGVEVEGRSLIEVLLVTEDLEVGVQPDKVFDRDSEALRDRRGQIPGATR